MNVHSTGNIGRGNRVDVVGGLVRSRPYCGRLVESREPFAITVDSLVGPIGNRNGRAGVWVVRVDVPLGHLGFEHVPVSKIGIRFGPDEHALFGLCGGL